MNTGTEVLNYVKQKKLKNAFNSQRDFLSLFPEDNFDFSSTEYTHFLYFDKDEAIAYLQDFMLFIKSYYKCEVFSYQNYYSIFNEFKKYLDANQIFLYTKTHMGLHVANYSNALLLETLKNLFGKSHFVGDDKKIAFSDSVIKNKTSFTYDFFNFLTKKVDGYNNYKFIVEPLLTHDIENIRNFYNGIHYKGSLPFYLDITKPYWKDTKHTLLEYIVGSEPTKAYAISKEEGVIIALVAANIKNNTCELTILCNTEFYDSDLSYPIDFICDNLFNKYNISKIVTVNNNKGIAFSGINSTLAISHFKPDYSLNSNFDGYSQIRYELTREINGETTKHIDNSLIRFSL